jgi:hypothetical protein
MVFVVVIMKSDIRKFKRMKRRLNGCDKICCRLEPKKMCNMIGENKSEEEDDPSSSLLRMVYSCEENIKKVDYGKMCEAQKLREAHTTSFNNETMFGRLSIDMIDDILGVYIGKNYDVQPTYIHYPAYDNVYTLWLLSKTCKYFHERIRSILYKMRRFYDMPKVVSIRASFNEAKLCGEALSGGILHMVKVDEKNIMTRFRSESIKDLVDSYYYKVPWKYLAIQDYIQVIKSYMDSGWIFLAPRDLCGRKQNRSIRKIKFYAKLEYGLEVVIYRSND